MLFPENKSESHTHTLKKPRGNTMLPSQSPNKLHKYISVLKKVKGIFNSWCYKNKNYHFVLLNVKSVLHSNGSRMKYCWFWKASCSLSEVMVIALRHVDFVQFLAILQDVSQAYLGIVNLLDWREPFLFEPECRGLMMWHAGNEIRAEQCFPREMCIQCTDDGINSTHHYIILHLLPIMN